MREGKNIKQLSEIMIALTRSFDLFMKTTQQEIENINKIIELRFATQNEIKDEINYFENKIETKITEINQKNAKYN